MSPARPPRTEQMRLATLLEIGRSLSAAGGPAALCRSVASRLAAPFESDLIFCAETRETGPSRLLLLVEDGDVRDVEQTYSPITDPATPERGLLLDADGARALQMPSARADRAVAALVVPIRADGQPLGELGAIRFEADAPFDDFDGELLSFAGFILGAALGERRRGEETRKRQREAERLEEIGRAMTGSLDLADVLERILQAVLDLAEADMCSVWQREGDTARVIASRGSNPLPPGFDVRLVPDVAAALIGRGESICFDDVSTDERLPASLRAELAGQRPRSAVLVPMICDRSVVGALSVGHYDRRRPGAETIRILERLALQGAIALENARLHAEIRSLSLTDPLTGMPNRRHMDMVLEKEIQAARRGRPLAVVVFDLNDFKAYNDTNGHAAGDEALREFARILMSETRAMNLAVRYGGDEFLTILSESTLEGGRHLVERVERHVRDSPILRDVGVSAGVAQYDDAMSTAADLVHAADVAMYESKAAPLSGGGRRARSSASSGAAQRPSSGSR